KNEAITQVADQISQMVKSNRTSVRMQLYPEELGHIDLRIVTTKNGIGVTMVADKASTQLALKSEMDLLRQSIEQAGIQLSNLNINQGHNSNRQQSFERRQNLSNSSYPETNSDNSNSTSNEPGVHLNSSVVDYRV
ncbi:MAG: flagellar hook-length control protein FliK, partial [Anaerolineae bacterium]|nr:flagellar hook-length control protein FliK [Anaerolineae bacterium]